MGACLHGVLILPMVLDQASHINVTLTALPMFCSWDACATFGNIISTICCYWPYFFARVRLPANLVGCGCTPCEVMCSVAKSPVQCLRLACWPSMACCYAACFPLDGHLVRSTWSLADANRGLET